MQQLFRLLIFLNHRNMFRATNSPILRSNFWLYVQLLVQFTASAADRCTVRQQRRCIVPKAVRTVKNGSWVWANFSPETCWDDLKRLINEKVVTSCWLFTSLCMSTPFFFSTTPIYTGCMGKHCVFVFYEKVLETLIEDVLARGICFCLCIVNLVQSLTG